MTIENYIDNINQRYKLGNATEHTFRGDLQNLLETLLPDIRATNEPKRQSCGAPDYILTNKDIFHYSKIIVSLTETRRIMQEIFSIEIE